MKADITISPVIGPIDPPPIVITAKDGRHRLARIELTPENFGLAVTGRLVTGEAETAPRQVFVVMSNDYPDGIFSREELAQAHIAARKAERAADGSWVHWKVYPFAIDDKRNLREAKS